MLSYLLKSRALFGIVAKEWKDQVFEFSAEVLATNLIEVGLGLRSHQQVVKVLFGACFFEGEDALHDDKEYNSKRE
jgi:hypothetical protein